MRNEKISTRLSYSAIEEKFPIHKCSIYFTHISIAGFDMQNEEAGS
jgi:hypothetical protein